jgi:hypothetical protein
VTVSACHPAYDPTCVWCRYGGEGGTATAGGATAAIRVPATRRWVVLAALFVAAAFAAGLIAGLR